MKFVTVRDFRTSPAQVWKQLPEEQEMVITNNGKPIALLTPLSDVNMEDTLKAVRKARALNAVKNMQDISLRNGHSSLADEDIQNEISESRKSLKV